MQPLANHTPITDDELDELSDLLDSLPSKEAMSLEMVDGFFAALIAGPEMVTREEYLPLVLGNEPDDETPAFPDAAQTERFLALLQSHWNTLAAELFKTLERDEVYVPVMAVYEDDQVRGNEWAIGFMMGTQMRGESWLGLLEDEDAEDLMTPMLMLAHEDHPDAELRSPPMSDKKREELIQDMAWNLTIINRYFADDRLTGGVPREPMRREAPKVGRNDPCPCGSGKKYKQCCGSAERLH
ncbi:MAG TPA: UPF0149 family protein [Burkholderiales bacterium]